MEIEFENAEVLAKENPDTFTIPSRDERESLAPGDYVKVCDGEERFWIEVVSKESDGSYNGKCGNTLLSGYAKLGDPMRFRPEHVYTIMTVAEQEQFKGARGT